MNLLKVTTHPISYRLPTGEWVFSVSSHSCRLQDFSPKFLNFEFFGFLTAFATSLVALCLVGG